MVIETTKAFDKQYSKLNLKVKIAFKRRVIAFKASPFDTGLRNHALKGKYLGFRSIDITGDVRALYTTQGDTIIIFGFIGTHSQLYG
ncbi:type II toxin-antitoxin system mRNA interferase toxin, RelE/StbE family [Polaromonas sp.]|nr:type II toxin-antitoxin system mRNA interferase toxin, RelE/StbE family [Candidatus Saccharibacteria bacterium]